MHVDYFDDYIIFDSDKKLASYLSYLEADIYHIHCKPASIPRVAIESLKARNKKYVYDVHDLDIVRFKKTNEEELFALLNSPYLIFPDEGTKGIAEGLLLNHLETKIKSLVLLPYFSLLDMVYPLIQINPDIVAVKVTKLVYEGNVIQPTIDNIKLFPYYDLRFTASIFTQYGFEFHLYPAGIDFNSVRQFYEGTGVQLHIPVSYPDLVKEMSQFGWGFFGCFQKDIQANTTFANKVFDYICAGIPVVVMNANRMGKWLEETGLGITIKGFEDIEKLKDIELWEELQQKILGERKKYSMEENIGPLEEFYEEMLGGTKEEFQEILKKEDIDNIKYTADTILENGQAIDFVRVKENESVLPGVDLAREEIWRKMNV